MKWIKSSEQKPPLDQTILIQLKPDNKFGEMLLGFLRDDREYHKAIVFSNFGLGCGCCSNGDDIKLEDIEYWILPPDLPKD